MGAGTQGRISGHQEVSYQSVAQWQADVASSVVAKHLVSSVVRAISEVVADADLAPRSGDHYEDQDRRD